jgi:hypothetical protein
MRPVLVTSLPVVRLPPLQTDFQPATWLLSATPCGPSRLALSQPIFSAHAMSSLMTEPPNWLSCLKRPAW